MLAALIMLILVCAWHGLATKMPVGDLGDVLDSGAFWFFVLLFVAFNVIFIIILSMKVRICGLAIIAFFFDTHVSSVPPFSSSVIARTATSSEHFFIFNSFQIHGAWSREES